MHVQHLKIDDTVHWQKKKKQQTRGREQRKAIEATAFVAASCLSSSSNYYEP